MNLACLNSPASGRHLLALASLLAVGALAGCGLLDSGQPSEALELTALTAGACQSSGNPSAPCVITVEAELNPSGSQPTVRASALGEGAGTLLAGTAACGATAADDAIVYRLSPSSRTLAICDRQAGTWLPDRSLPDFRAQHPLEALYLVAAVKQGGATSAAAPASAAPVNTASSATLPTTRISMLVLASAGAPMTLAGPGGAPAYLAVPADNARHSIDLIGALPLSLTLTGAGGSCGATVSANLQVALTCRPAALAQQLAIMAKVAPPGS